MNESRRQILLDTPHTETATGAIASFETDMVGRAKEVKVEIEPVQDLHGYENPWPAGGGANKWDEEWEYGAYGSGGQKIDSTTAIRNVNPIPVVAGNTYYIVKPSGTGNIRTVFRNANDENIGYVNSATQTRTAPEGAVTLGFCIMDYGKAYENDISVNNPSTTTTYSPYSNICPISGWEGANVEAKGKNLFDFGELAGLGSAVSAVTNGYRFSVTRQQYMPGIAVKLLEKSRITISARIKSLGATNIRLRVTYADGTFQDSQGTSATEYTTQTLVSYVGRTVTSIRLNWSQAGSMEVVDFMVNYGTTALPYEPYHGSTTPISWADEAGTVYGGTLTWEKDGSVTLTVDRAMVDLGTLNWAYITDDGDPYFRASISARKKGYNNLFCSSLKVMQASGTSRLDNVAIVGSSSGTYVFVRWFDYTDAASFKTAMSGGQLVYELATPITYTLTPQEALTLLRGTNNVWNDINDTTVTYWTHKTGDSV